MTLKERRLIVNAKNKEITTFLRQLGRMPVKETSWYALYRAPYRADNHPSMIVYKRENRWTDLARGMSGDIIDLTKLMYGYNFTDAVNCINNTQPSESIPTMTGKVVGEIGMGLSVTDLKNPRLLSYLSTRRIDLNIACHYCVEVYYQHKGRQYYALGFENISHAYETRNSFFKRCLGPKDISIIKQKGGNKTCYVFEGFMDFLSYLTLNKTKPRIFQYGDDVDIIVLNSVAMARPALDYICCYDNVTCFLDNDDAGQKAFGIITKAKPTAVDGSSKYAGYKDLNDFLRDRKLP
jgi:hypothetical protein